MKLTRSEKLRRIRRIVGMMGLRIDHAWSERRKKCRRIKWRCSRKAPVTRQSANLATLKGCIFTMFPDTIAIESNELPIINAYDIIIKTPHAK